jgi:hypothetical protein
MSLEVSAKQKRLRVAAILLMAGTTTVSIVITVLDQIQLNKAFELGVMVVPTGRSLAVALILLLGTVSLLSKTAMKVSVVISAILYLLSFSRSQRSILLFWVETQRWVNASGKVLIWANNIVPAGLLIAAVWVWVRNKDRAIAALLAPAYVCYLHVVWFLEIRRRFGAGVTERRVTAMLTDESLHGGSYWSITLFALSLSAAVVLGGYIKSKKAE